MLKKCKVVMLLTEKAEDSIVLSLNKAWYFKGYFTQDYLKSQNKTSHHLYFLSDDKIEEGDWYITNGQLIKYDGCYEKGRGIKPIAWFGGKVIASTDSRVIYDFSTSGTTFVSQPSKEFIQRYIDAYNRNEIISEVNVKYEIDIITKPVLHDGLPTEEFVKNIYTPKVNSSNKISITRYKDSWTREEVISLLKDLRNGLVHVSQKEIDITNNFIEETL